MQLTEGLELGVIDAVVMKLINLFQSFAGQVGKNIIVQLCIHSLQFINISIFKAFILFGH